jgi:hypothetical protein
MLLSITAKELNLHSTNTTFSGLKYNSDTTALEFYLDGNKVSHISTNGSYNDDI